MKGDAKFNKLLQLWSAWKMKPRKPLVEMHRNTAIVFVLIPIFSVLIGGKMVIGMDDSVSLIQRLAGVPLAIIGLSVLYAAWVYTRRPTKRNE